MFQAREPQESLWQSEFLITPRKAELMRRSWAEVFRNGALVLIEEELDLTDIEALEELEFNLLWHHAPRLEMEEAHLAQKTLHNFRVRLMEHRVGIASRAGDRVRCGLGKFAHYPLSYRHSGSKVPKVRGRPGHFSCHN